MFQLHVAQYHVFSVFLMFRHCDTVICSPIICVEFFVLLKFRKCVSVICSPILFECFCLVNVSSL